MNFKLPQKFTMSVEVQIRACVEADLPALEWFGEFRAHRAIIREAFAAQERGEGMMLLADAGGFPVGQAWIDFKGGTTESAAFLWALRVIPWMQRRGLAARLLAAVEELARQRGFASVESSVEIENAAAQAFHEAQGFRVVGERLDDDTFTTPDGETVRMCQPRRVLRKTLAAGSGIL
jgi:ribosomal protein S18 acetylase RimI-like enzyme